MVLFCNIKIIGACKPCRFFKIYCNPPIFAMYQDESEICQHSSVTLKTTLCIKNPEGNSERFSKSHIIDCNIALPYTYQKKTELKYELQQYD